MYTRQHIILGVLFSGICFLLFPSIGLIGPALILLSTVLIDFDHYVYYVHKKKDFSLKKARKWFIVNANKLISLPQEARDKSYVGFCFLHGVEILLIVLLLTFVSKYFFFIFVGFSLHMLFDIFTGVSYTKRIDRFSVINDFLKFKTMQFIEDVRD